MKTARIAHAASAPAVLTTLALLGACVPAPSTVELLDESTGVTVRQMGRPLEFHAPGPQGMDAAWFAYFGAFEVNRMGVIERFAWVSILPATLVEKRAARSELALTLLADGKPIALEFASSSPAAAGLSKTPYRRPAEWARDGYFRITLDQLRTLRAAASLELSADDGSGERRHYKLWQPDVSSLHAFVDQLKQ
jgi:hypothetical protein